MYSIQVASFQRTFFRQVVKRICAGYYCCKVTDRQTEASVIYNIGLNFCAKFQSLQNDNCSFRTFSTSRTLCIEVKLKSDVNNACTILGVDPDCDIGELREAYLTLAKKYHPDSGCATADPRKFSQVKEAYRSVLEAKKGGILEKDDPDDPDKYIYDIKHTAPQHRQYLSFEGIGFGSPSQRQKQYEQYRVWKAAANVQEHRIQNLASETETALVVQDKKHAKKIKISNAIERVVEDLIQESMNKGDFDNLSGSGKPLEYVGRNPMVDTETHNLNKILINNGFTPEWITLQSEIRNEMKDARQKLSILAKKLRQEPAEEMEKKWQSQIKKYKLKVNDINEKIDKYNMIVPFIDKQFAHFDAEKDIRRISNNFEKYLPSEEETERMYNSQFLTQEQFYIQNLNHGEKIKWSEVWHNIKLVFKSTSTA
ncbi:dnaJ homolog subfamily C member 28 [Patella vulgata]|uniref:dnaJ homolog subfamily C member 28 n=1 Tax=Patella vulgata TaxID=6465 RepID=UPI00217FE393|nr:dnaJ homolog subfamily C member 28 [Patella vulgata]XP_055959131.1 dnaJ homolog subfamily C member 28 [Patella vulgata]